MCILCDINILHCVFSNCENDFSPVRKWIFEGRGKLVYGGTSYLNELKRVSKYNGLLKELKNKNRVVVVNEEEVNRVERIVKRQVDITCNDPHLIAILAVSGCKLVCSNDKSSYRFLKESKFYPYGNRPKIYSKKGNCNLLIDSNISDCCLPNDRQRSKRVKRRL